MGIIIVPLSYDDCHFFTALVQVDFDLDCGKDLPEGCDSCLPRSFRSSFEVQGDSLPSSDANAP